MLLRSIYIVTLFLSAFLLFLVQPLIGKLLLPVFGGSAAVWTTCMLFFQACLFGGYIYAHFASSFIISKKRSLIHLGLAFTGLLFLPSSEIHGVAISGSTASIIFMVFRYLGLLIAFQFFILSSTAPLLQKWFSFTEDPDAGDPYFLYAASNTGSLIALLGYPVLFEPWFDLHRQVSIWNTGYAIMCLLLGICSLLPGSFTKGSRDSETTDCEANHAETTSFPSGTTAQTPDKSRIAKWLLWSFLPSSLVLGITSHITTDIAAVPLIWIIPLALYLLTFILAFRKGRKWISTDFSYAAIGFFIFNLFVFRFRIQNPAWLIIFFNISVLFFVCLIFHFKLAEDRPPPRYLTSYFLWISVGGMLGGIFNGLAAPLIFSTHAEYPIVLAFSVFFIPLSSEKRTYREKLFLPMLVFSIFARLFYEYESLSLGSSYGQSISWLGLVILCFITATFRPKLFGTFFLISLLAWHLTNPAYDFVIKGVRGFYGMLQIRKTPDEAFHLLSHGTTFHGAQRIKSGILGFPLFYYVRDGPMGSVFREMTYMRRGRNIGIVGLGVGSLAWYGRPWQHFHFFEIDPLMVDIAQDPELFTFLSDCPASKTIHLGDARITLENVPDGHFDLLVLDAYLSDSIPVHLMTIEAFRLYLRKLAPKGILTFHVSHRYLDLEPIVGNICKELNLASKVMRFTHPAPEVKYDDASDYVSAAKWIAVARDESEFGRITDYPPGWDEVHTNDNLSIWTDGYSNIWRIYNWD